MRSGRPTGVIRRGAAVVAKTSLCVLFLFVACMQGTYRGDGTFRDGGAFFGTGRYRVDLGSLDIGTASERRYSLAGLPTERFTIGVAFASDAPGWSAAANNVLRLELLGDGKVVHRAGGPLHGWLKSQLSGYPLFLRWPGQTDTWSETPGTAWGSTFIPAPGVRYDLLVVVEPAQKGPWRGTLLLEGGPRDVLP